jgi:protein-disulfide isomerase
MSKRQEIRQRRQREKTRNQIMIVILVMAGSLLVVLALIQPGLKQAAGAATSVGKPIVQITPMVINIPLSGTTMGFPNAPVKMDVWEDFQCSGCMYFSTQIAPLIIRDYVETGEVDYTYHFMPFIDGGAGESHQAANAAMCANEQGQFWQYHDILFANWTGENVGDYTDDRLIAYAESIGLDMNAFEKCFDANTYASYISQDEQMGEDMGVPPTPGIFINGKVVTNSQNQNLIPTYQDLSNAIEAEMAGN